MYGNDYDENLFAEFFDFQPQALLWLQPQWDNSGILSDFVYTYANREGLKYLNLQPEMLKKTTVFSIPSLTDEMRGKIFNEMVTVYETGRTLETFNYNPAVDKYGRVLRSRFRNGILNIIHDSTKENQAIEQLEKQTAELNRHRTFSNSILDASSNGIFAMEAIRSDDGSIVDFKIVKINKAFTVMTGMSAEEVEDKRYLSLFPSSVSAGSFQLNLQVLESGMAARREMFYRGEGLDGWYDISAVKWGGNGLVVTFADISDRKKNEIERDEYNELVQTMLNASFHGEALLEPVWSDATEIVDFKIVAANSSTEAQIGIAPSQAVGRQLSAVLPGYRKSGGFNLYCEALITGKPQRQEQYYEDDSFSGWFDVYVTPVSKGVVVSFANITETKNEQLRIQHQRNLLDAILTYSPTGISVTEIIKDEHGRVIDGKTILANDAAVRYVGIPKNEYLSKTAREIDPSIMDSPVYQMAVNTLETGTPFHTQYFLQPTKRWLELSVAKMDDSRLVNVFTDITDKKEAQLRVEQLAEKLRAVVNTSQAGFFLAAPIYDQDRQIVDFKFTMVNQVLASFVGKEPDELSGEPGSNWFVAYKKNGLFDLFKETYISGSRQQFDIHYRGETVDVWANVKTARLGDELLGSFTDFTELKYLQLQLEKSVEELRRSNQNLEEFAYVASHDLQEPLRKINFFAEQLRNDLNQQLTGENIKKFDRMKGATNRMRNLINDLLEYSKVSVKPDAYEDIDLCCVVEQVLQDLEATIMATGATVSVGELPTIKGDERQLAQVFQNLLSNALKYRKPNVSPVVYISSRLVDETDPVFAAMSDVVKRPGHLVEISDNGIGFDQNYAEKIFQVFQRLHGRTEYEGTGVGLAIVQKVIANHKGYITAKSEAGKGSAFTIFLPQSNRINTI